MARILGHVLGRRVKMPMPLVPRAARMQGVAPPEASGFVRCVEDHRQSAVAPGALTGESSRRPGRRPRASRPPPAAPPTGPPRAVADVLRLPLMPGHDLGAHVRRQGSARLAMDGAGCVLARRSMPPLDAAAPRMTALVRLGLVGTVAGLFAAGMFRCLPRRSAFMATGGLLAWLAFVGAMARSDMLGDPAGRPIRWSSS